MSERAVVPAPATLMSEIAATALLERMEERHVTVDGVTRV
jgi:hypothetical protein